MAADILVNEKTVEDGLLELEKVPSYIKKAESAVASLKSSVPAYISVKGFSIVESLLTAATSNCIEIIDKCNEYIAISKGIDDSIVKCLVPIPNLKVPEGQQLSQKPGPYNPNFLEDYRKIILEQNSDLRNELITSAFTDYKTIFMSQGISEKDADRVINGEITLEKLYEEIATDPDRERYRLWLEAQYLTGCAYSYSDSKEQLELLNQKKSGIESELSDVKSSINDLESQLSRRQVPDGQDINQLYEERSRLEKELKDVNKEIIDITLSIEGHGEVDINFKNMEELASAIDRCYNAMSLLTAKLRQAKKEMYEAVSYDKFIFELASSQSIESALETIVAFSYTDDDGYVYYSFDLTDVSSNKKDIKYITYKDLYGDSLATKKTIEMLSSIGEDEDISTKIYEAQEYVLDNYDEFFKGNEFDSSKVDEINEELTAKIREKNIYLSIQSNINENVNFYLTNIDQYMINEDFAVNCKFKGDYGIVTSTIGDEDGLDVDEYTARAILYLVNDFETDANGTRTYNVNMKNNANNALALGTGEYINVAYFNKSVHYEYGTNPTNHSEMVKNYSSMWREIMSNEEILAFNYVCNIFGYKEGYKFLERIMPTLDKRYNQISQSKDKEFSYDFPFLASLGSIFVKPIEGFGGFGYSINCLANGVNMQRSRLYSHADAWRSNVSTNIRILSGDTAAFFYNTTMSIGDSGLVIILTTATGGGSLVFSTSIMGSSVYLSTLNEALDRNIEPNTAVLLALTAATFESLMESKSVAHLIGLEKEFTAVLGGGGIVDKIIEKLTRAGISSDTATKLVAMGYCILNQSLVEGDEEFWTEVLDYLADWVISGDLSKRELNIKKYREEHPGCSDAEAYFYEYKNLTGDLEMAWLGGAVSGTFFGVGAGAKYTFNSNYSKMMLLNFLNNEINNLQINHKLQEGAQNANNTKISPNNQTSTNTDAIVTQFNTELNDNAKVINVNENNEAIIETKYGDKISVPIEQLNSANTIYVVERLNRVFELKERLQFQLTDDAHSNSRFFEISSEDLNELNIMARNGNFKYSYYYVADGNNGFRIIRVVKKGGVSLASLNKDGVVIDPNAFFYGEGRYSVDNNGIVTDNVTGFTSVISPVVDDETKKHIFEYDLAQDGRNSFKGGHTHAILTMSGVTLNGVTHLSNGVDICNLTIEVNGKRYNKTTSMFPESWSNEKILSAIEEVTNGKPFNFQINGNIVYRGIVDGVEMLVIVNPTGRVDTAYPINPKDPKSGYNILSLGDFLGPKITINDTNAEVNLPDVNSNNNNDDLSEFYKKLPEFFVRGATSLSGLYAFCMELSQMNGLSFEEYMQKKLAVGDFSDIELFKGLYPYLQRFSKFLSNRSIGRLMTNIGNDIWTNNMVMLDSWQELFEKYPSVYKNIIKNNGIFEYNGDAYAKADDLRFDLDTGKIEKTDELEFAYKIMKFYNLAYGDSLYMIDENKINSLNESLNSKKAELDNLYAQLNDATTDAERESITNNIKITENLINQINNEILDATEELAFKDKYLEVYLNKILNEVVPAVKKQMKEKLTADEYENIIKIFDIYINNWFTQSAITNNHFNPLSRMGEILDSFRNVSFDEYISKLNNAIETVRIIPTVLNLFNNSENQNLQTLLNLIRKELMNIPTDNDHGSVDSDFRTHNLLGVNKFFDNTIDFKYIEKYMKMLSDDFDNLKNIESTDEYIRQIGIIWYKFMLIHPYADGNGRTGRILLNILFAQRNISVPSLFNTADEQSQFLAKLDTYIKNGKVDIKGLGDAFFEHVNKLINSVNIDTGDQITSPSSINLNNDDQNIDVQNQIIELLISDEFNNADFNKQMQMISEVPGYDLLPTETKVSIYIMLLEIVAEEKGLDLKKLSELTGEGIISQDILDNAKQYAKNISDKAKQSEPAIRKVLQGFEDDDCILIGLEKSLKTEESITRKILFDMNQSNMKMKDAADAIGDSVRFTYIIDPNNYTQKTVELLGKIRDSGYEILKIKNTWDSAMYKGVNVSLKAPDGTLFEVQFHTTDSFIVKECDTHLFYEIRRNENVPAYDRALAKKIQKLFTSTILIPEGILEINLNKEFNIPDTTIEQNNNINLSSLGIDNVIRDMLKGTKLKNLVSTPTQIALENALNNGLKNTKILIGEQNEFNMKTVLMSLDLDKISPDVINKFITNDGFDFANFLEYTIRNNMLSNRDLNKLKNLSAYKHIMMNPSARLSTIIDNLKDITDLVNTRGWNAFFTDSYYNESLFKYNSFLAYLVTRDFNFRQTYKSVLYDIARKLNSIETAYIKLKYINKISYKGMEIKVYGDDEAFLKNATQRLIEALDKLPPFLLKQFTLLKNFSIYDTVAPGDLSALFNNDQYFNDPNDEPFITGGDYNWEKNEIRLFKWDFIRNSDVSLFGTIVHELAHALDNAIGIMNGSFKYLSETTILWRNAKDKDGNMVSKYGNSKIVEDFADTVKYYVEAALGMLDISFEDYRNKYSNRIQLLEAMITLRNWDGNPKSLKLEDRVKIFNAFGSNLTYNLCELIYGSEYLKQLGYKPYSVKYQFALFNRNMHFGNFMAELMSNPKSTFLNNLDVDDIISLIDIYTYDEYRDRIVYKLFENKFKRVNLRCIDELMNLNVSTDREKSLINDICRELTSTYGTTSSVVRYLSSTSDISRKMFRDVMNILIRYSRR